MENKKITIFLFIGGIILILLGGTFAYWSWSSTQAQQTAVTFTVASGFTCSADGGGDITSNDVELIPAHCNNSNYAIKRTVTVNPTITDSNTDVSLTMWLNVVSMSSGLRNSDNFKYVLTKNENDCTNAVTQGTFKNVADGGTVPLLTSKTYEETATDTYYLYIWLDYAEESNSTMNQTFHFTLGGTCTDEVIRPNYVYTANTSSDGYVYVGQPILGNITTYSTPELAMAALKTASGGTTDYPFFLRHRVEDLSAWCIVRSDEINYCGDYFETESACTAYLQDAVTNDGATDNGDGTISMTQEGKTYTYSCNQQTLNEVTESYVGFVVTDEMAAANTGMTAGTYYLRGGVNDESTVNENKAILLTAFGNNNCNFNDGSSASGVNYAYSNSKKSNLTRLKVVPILGSYPDCSVSGLYASPGSSLRVSNNAHGTVHCSVDQYGSSYCNT